ncbi:MAG: pyridoxal phosphate-dependent aminotransferase [Candidatus Karelsulcia muelleri]
MTIYPSFNLKKISEYYFSKKNKELKFLEKKGKKIINLGIGNPDLFPPLGVIKTMKKASENENANKYQEYLGIPNLRKKFSEWYYKNYKIDLNPKNEILPLMGSKEGILYTSMAYINKNDYVLIPNPGYPTYTSISKLIGGKIIYYSLIEKNKWLPNLFEINKFNLNKVKIFWINYPHMPTGAKINIEELEKIVFFSIKNNILLVHDNPYSFILNDNPISIFNIKKSKDVSLELNTLSKSYNMAGWRIGMIAGKKNILENIIKIQSQVHSGMYFPIQKGAIEAMKFNNNWFISQNKEYSKRRNIIWEICDLLKISYYKNSAGLFVWGKLNNKNDILWTNKILYKYKIFITPGSIFGSNGKGYVRLSLCCKKQFLKTAKKRIIKNY